MEIVTTEQLVASIEAFLVDHDMRPTRFGREATGEPQLLSSLRSGRSPSLDTANRIIAFMRTFPPISHDAVAHCSVCSARAEHPSVQSCSSPDCPMRPRVAA